ncbi:MAG: RNA-binding S4 domain-containing protein [Saprospiraceae bacterium]|nr:RNA-binding S4 domain-containing protein [Saprospiraceae bacterium]
MPEKVRLDKWLWAVRIYKSRTIATDACKKGKIRSNTTDLKASHLVKPQDIIEVRKNGFNFSYKILILIEKRVSASEAAKCYENLTSPEELNKYNSWFTSTNNFPTREKGSGRPTKKERRELDELV